MNILVIGSGGREHALLWKLSQSSRVSSLYAAPGNPGMAKLATTIPLSPGDLNGLAGVAEREHIDLTVVGPEQPLADGIVDLFRDRGFTIFGPTRAAAALESSKAFAKQFMERHHIPTASFRTFNAAQREKASSFVRQSPLPLVLKADGLAAGKGVVVCSTHEEAEECLDTMLSGEAFGQAGTTVVVEEFLAGVEASVFAVCDGKRYVTLAPAQDHKRVGDGDTGKNTGGMGAYAPAPHVTPEVLESVRKKIIAPTLEGMRAEGTPFAGCLYVGLMLTPEGPRVVEYNVRFGDPETQAVLPVYPGDLAELLSAASTGTISANQGPAPTGHAVCVVLASGGYPDAYRTGQPIEGLERLSGRKDVMVFHAGTREDQGRIVTAGGRVLGVTAIRKSGTLREAIDAAYSAVQLLSFEGMHARSDIGQKGLLTGGR
jgi:phosphoribosylamine--glycine ligase